MYANQGKTSDYQLLNQTVDLRGTIAITRYGGAGRGDKVSCTTLICGLDALTSALARRWMCHARLQTIEHLSNRKIEAFIFTFILYCFHPGHQRSPLRRRGRARLHRPFGHQRRFDVGRQ